MELIRPSEQYQKSYISYIEELENEERYPFTLDLEFKDFARFLDQLHDFSLGKNLPKNAVQNTTLWLIDNAQIVGVTNLRHHLNEEIEHIGGHIGLSIRPSSRGKGLGSTLMHLSMEQLILMGARKIHIHCYKTNLSSAKIIMNNGGILDSEIRENENIVQRYVKIIA